MTAVYILVIIIMMFAARTTAAFFIIIIEALRCGLSEDPLSRCLPTFPHTSR